MARGAHRCSGPGGLGRHGLRTHSLRVRSPRPRSLRVRSRRLARRRLPPAHQVSERGAGSERLVEVAARCRTRRRRGARLRRHDLRALPARQASARHAARQLAPEGPLGPHRPRARHGDAGLRRLVRGLGRQRPGRLGGPARVAHRALELRRGQHRRAPDPQRLVLDPLQPRQRSQRRPPEAPGLEGRVQGRRLRQHAVHPRQLLEPAGRDAVALARLVAGAREPEPRPAPDRDGARSQRAQHPPRGRAGAHEAGKLRLDRLPGRRRARDDPADRADRPAGLAREARAHPPARPEPSPRSPRSTGREDPVAQGRLHGREPCLLRAGYASPRHRLHPLQLRHLRRPSRPSLTARSLCEKKAKVNHRLIKAGSHRHRRERPAPSERELADAISLRVAIMRALEATHHRHGPGNGLAAWLPLPSPLGPSRGARRGRRTHLRA